MAKAIFKYKNTGQIITTDDASKIKIFKKNPKYTLLSEEKPKRGRPAKEKEEQLDKTE